MRKLRLGTETALAQSHRISKQWGQDPILSLSVPRPRLLFPLCFTTLLKGPSKDSPHSRVHTHGPGRQAEGCLSLCSLVQAAVGSTEAPEEAGIRGTGGLGRVACRLPGGRKDAARGPPGFPPEPQGPRCPSTGPLPSSGFLPQPSKSPEGPASSSPLPPRSQPKATAKMPS